MEGRKAPLSSNPWVSILGMDKEKDQATFWMATNRWLKHHILSFFKISYFWIDECLVCLTQNSIKLCAKRVTKENVIGIQLVQSSIQNSLPICTSWCAKLILKENTLGTYREIGCHENPILFLLFACQNIYKKFAAKSRLLNWDQAQTYTYVYNLCKVQCISE